MARTVVITGANRGLGLELARRYAATGARVTATARDLAAATDLTALPVSVVECDVRSDAEVERLAAEAPNRIELLINNAGHGGQRETSVLEADFESLMDTHAINAIGPLRVTRALWPKLVDGRATIVHVSSLMGSIADSSGARYSYRMSKAALNMGVRCLAYECEPHGMTTFAIHPGWVRTEMGGPEGRLSIEESVEAMIATIQTRTSAANGRFINRHGEPLPW